MTKEILRRLELLNQLSLTDEEKVSVMTFFDAREKDAAVLDTVDTSKTERMVHVMPIMTVVREDVASQPYSREALQASAPETDEGYWCVPRVLE